MKAGDKVICINDDGAEGWLKQGETYVLEAVVGFMDEVQGSSDEAAYYGNMADVSAKGYILVGVDARYWCGGRMAFHENRFRSAEGKTSFISKLLSIKFKDDAGKKYTGGFTTVEQ